MCWCVHMVAQQLRSVDVDCCAPALTVVQPPPSASLHVLAALPLQRLLNACSASQATAALSCMAATGPDRSRGSASARAPTSPTLPSSSCALLQRHKRVIRKNATAMRLLAHPQAQKKFAHRGQRVPHAEQRVVARAAWTALASTARPSAWAAAAPFGPWVHYKHAGSLHSMLAWVTCLLVRMRLKVLHARALLWPQHAAVPTTAAT